MHSGSDHQTIRVVTWNIHKCVGGTDGRYSPRRIIDCLAGYDAKILLLQEVARGIPRLGGEDQVAILSEGLGMHAAFHPEHCFKAGYYGNLILSAYPLSHIEHIDLTIGWRKVRGAIQGHVRIPIGEHRRTVVVHNLHLGLAGSERAQQLSRFVESDSFNHLHASTPLIVAGDLNDLWGSLGPRFLAPQRLQRAGTLRNTFPAALPLRPLDGIFFRGSVRLRHFEVGSTRLAKTASDHRPLIADFEVSMG
ncbi:MAG TPA: endonuclease/exonuclease/phosphatase family protein [Polyangiaceae bacterium]|nr:endonuclease/exonuclease/phosphatase family protein [Polyangiaceae bacterium]